MKITKFLKRFKKQLAVVGTLLVLAVPAIAIAEGWGPARPVFDYNDPQDRIGSTTGPVFNSFINTPSYGDERNFMRVSTDNGAHWVERANVKPGQTVMFKAYIHNNANQDLNGTNFNGIGVAKDTSIRFYIPSGQANGFDVAGYISADNAKPVRVYDTATVTNNNQRVSLSYVSGSATLFNQGPFKNGKKISNGAVANSGDGALIGWNALNGVFPGCFEFDAVVIIKVKVNAPKLDFNKQVTVPGSTTWKENTSVNRGDTVSWLLKFENDGGAVMQDVTLRDVIPAGLTLVPGSITWFDANHPSGQVLADTVLNSGGINLGDYGVNSNGFIRFRTVVDKNSTPCEFVNEGFARAKNISEKKNTAKVTVKNCVPPKPPKPPVTPPTKEEQPKELVDTGPGSIVGIFTGTSLAGAFLHRKWMLRRDR